MTRRTCHRCADLGWIATVPGPMVNFPYRSRECIDKRPRRAHTMAQPAMPPPAAGPAPASSFRRFATVKTKASSAYPDDTVGPELNAAVERYYDTTLDLYEDLCGEH